MTCKYDGCDNPRDGARSYCRPCRHHMRTYGITTPERDRMLKDQDHSCMICGSTIQFKGAGGSSKHHAVVDHCHVSGNVRGILCSACNTGLGAYRDDIKTMEKAIAYLEVHHALR